MTDDLSTAEVISMTLRELAGEVRKQGDPNAMVSLENFASWVEEIADLMDEKHGTPERTGNVLVATGKSWKSADAARAEAHDQAMRAAMEEGLKNLDWNNATEESGRKWFRHYFHLFVSERGPE